MSIFEGIYRNIENNLQYGFGRGGLLLSLMDDMRQTSPQSPPVGRTVAVLNFLAQHPDQSFTLSEIAKSLRLSSATCHTLLGTLVEEGYVYRTAGKTYVLGPALARVAKASLSPGLVMQVVRPEMRLLADEFDVVCSAFRLSGDQAVIWERAAAISHVNWNMQHTLSVSVTAPLGGIFMAWRTAAEVDKWLEAANPPLGEAPKARLRGSLQFLRERGYTWGVRTVPLADADTARALQNQRALTDYAVPELEPEREYPLAYVAAPVLPQIGKMAFGLSLAGFIRPVRGRRIEAIGERLRESCERIAAFLAGREAEVECAEV
jgi:DNA-binding IclR family transcriptional regulator